jgi:hypothetical protein
MLAATDRPAPDDQTPRSRPAQTRCNMHNTPLSGPLTFGQTDIRSMIPFNTKVRTTMESDIPLLRPSAARVTVAYLLAVTAATGYIVASQFPRVIAQRASDGLLYPLGGTLAVLLSDCLTIFVLWLPAAFFSALPCTLINLLVSRYRIRSPLFYVFWGCALGLLAVAPVIWATSGWTWYTDPPGPSRHPTFWQEFLSIANTFAVAGAIGGLTYWGTAVRHLHRESS